MAREKLNSQNSEGAPFEVKRSKEEIEQRIMCLQEKRELNDVWIHYGFSETQHPESKRRTDILDGRIEELKWILGEER